MPRNSVLLVSLLLVVGGVFAPVSVGADHSPSAMDTLVVSMNDTANYLSIPGEDVTQTGKTTDGLSLATAIATDTSALQSTHTRITFEQSFRKADADSEKTAIIRTTADRVDRRQQSLERRDRNLIRAYANGSMTAAQFTRERAQIHESAKQLRVAIQRVDRVARADDSYSLPTHLKAQLAALAAELEVLQGPVSDHVVSTAGGETDGQTIYAEASRDGYTLAYVTDDSYVRETYLGDERKPNETDTFDEGDEPAINAATNRGYALYPWVTNHSVSPNSFGPFGDSGIYRFTVDFFNGELTAYIDGGTTNVFRESQRYKLAAIPVQNTITSTNDTVRMRVNKTYETGPLHIETARNGTGVPINGTVTVDGEPAGHTGDDGSLWIVEPRGPDRITMTTTSNESVGVYLPS